MDDKLLVPCRHCGANNRVPRQRIERGEQAVCGKCRAPLAVFLRPVAVTDASFAAEVEQSPLPVVLDVWAAWCGPCRMLAPIVDELASDLAGRVKFAKLNLDENRRTADRFQVSSIPTLLVFSGGELVDEIVGLVPKGQLAARLQRFAG
ncbi:MAG: thioredoxin [Pirellulales bacterium]|nr:thioredoxin [Pirellulales bacterium]